MAQLPDGLIFEYEVDHENIKIDVIQRELVKCKQCVNATASVNWGGEVSPDQVHCNYGLGSLRKLDDFCSSGKRKETDFENQKT